MRNNVHILLCASATLLASCITNDLPYPQIEANFTYISAAGQSRPADIDTMRRTVTFTFPEDVDIYKVRIDSFALTPKASVTSGNLETPVDLSVPYDVTLSLYQDYPWTLVGVQDIERYFTIDGQIGTSVIDATNHTVTAQVSKTTSLATVSVIRCKLGATGAVMTPELQGRTCDFTSPVHVDVESYGHTVTWTIAVEQVESAVSTLRADAWTCVAWVYGEAEAGRHNTVQYRLRGDTGWITAPDEWITAEGGDFCACLRNLQPLTSYETRAVSDNEYGETIEFTTGASVQVPNSDFDQWWLDGKVWDPWPEGGLQVWDTGNKGAATLGQSNSVPTDDTVTGTGYAAMLQTKFVGIGMLGKLAAGNIFVGRFVRTEGTNGVLSMGHGFTERPTRLRGYLKYRTAPISSVTTGFSDLKGRPDTCTVWVALIDSDEPLEIRTNPSNRQLFDPQADYVVAYGSYQSGDDIPAYMPFEITLDYRSTSRRPRYILITASASKYGDYFTGGNGAVLCVDDFVLDYDY